MAIKDSRSILDYLKNKPQKFPLYQEPFMAKNQLYYTVENAVQLNVRCRRLKKFFGKWICRRRKKVKKNLSLMMDEGEKNKSSHFFRGLARSIRSRNENGSETKQEETKSVLITCSVTSLYISRWYWPMTINFIKVQKYYCIKEHKI